MKRYKNEKQERTIFAVITLNLPLIYGVFLAEVRRLSKIFIWERLGNAQAIKPRLALGVFWG